MVLYNALPPLLYKNILNIFFSMLLYWISSINKSSSLIVYLLFKIVNNIELSKINFHVNRIGLTIISVKIVFINVVIS